MPFYETHGVSTKSLISLAGVDATEGIRLVSTPLIAPGELPDGDKQKAVSLEFKAEFEKTFGAEANYFGGIAYDTILVAASALKRAGSTDKAKLRDTIEQTDDVIGTAGQYRMSAADHSGLSVEGTAHVLDQERRVEANPLMRKVRGSTLEAGPPMP